MSETATVLFLCPHNAAKSVLAVAEFEKLARACGLPFRADSAGTEPDDHPAPLVVAALQDEGIDVSGHRPRHVTPADVANAHLIVSLGCDVDALAPPDAHIEDRNDVPPVSEDLARARDVIRQHVATLVETLAQDEG